MTLAAQFGDPYAPGIVPSAVVVELTHLATLYHDDVMDEADVRRGVPSANQRWGNSVAVLTGDFLLRPCLAHPSADLGPDAVRIQAEAFERPSPARSWRRRARPTAATPSTTTSTYFSGKTGSLIAVASPVRRHDVRRRRDRRRRPDPVRERLGVAFQLADDVLDIASDLARVRQDPGHRPARGHPPRCRCCGCASARHGSGCRRTRRSWSSSTPTCGRRGSPRRSPRLRAHPALEQARRDTVRYAEEACRPVPAPGVRGEGGTGGAGCDAVVHRRLSGCSRPVRGAGNRAARSHRRSAESRRGALPRPRSIAGGA
ncbi:polyprenyl synthetase family protein [Streptomyces sp. KL116D]|uniref:polyprenyl synthetase family protein n=1 Tax=Streptomyces sp. KL116D TaxID=3045152 RepID=UPI003555C198